MKHLTFIGIMFACILGSADAESASTADNKEAVAQIEQIVQQFQTHIINKDAAALGALFLPENNSWLTVLDDETYAAAKKKKPDASKVFPSTYGKFVAFVGNSKKPIEEKFFNVKIETNGAVGSVYFDFTFHQDGVVSNRGSESWHMVKTADGWKISSMIYSVGR